MQPLYPHLEAKALGVLDQSMTRYEPSHLFAMFSGGHDSLTATRIASKHPNFSAAVHINTGIGIPAEDISRIYDIFLQLDDSTNRRYPGAGLGLALVKYLIQSIDGKIFVNSEVGQCTTFELQIPFDLIQ